MADAVENDSVEVEGGLQGCGEGMAAFVDRLGEKEGSEEGKEVAKRDRHAWDLKTVRV